MLYYQEEMQIKQARHVRELSEIEYKYSFRGTALKSLRRWYLRFFLAIFFMVYLSEDISNPESPRLHFWKQKFSIPELEDFILHEIVSAADKQEQPIGPKDKNKEKKDYWLELEPLRYANAEDANAVTFKEFVYTHIRMYLPSEYKQLVVSWPAIEKWKNIEYLLDKIGNQYVEGVHYHGFKPFRNFAGGNIF